MYYVLWWPTKLEKMLLGKSYQKIHLQYCIDWKNSCLSGSTQLKLMHFKGLLCMHFHPIIVHMTGRSVIGRESSVFANWVIFKRFLSLIFRTISSPEEGTSSILVPLEFFHLSVLVRIPSLPSLALALAQPQHKLRVAGRHLNHTFKNTMASWTTIYETSLHFSFCYSSRSLAHSFSQQRFRPQPCSRHCGYSSERRNKTLPPRRRVMRQTVSAGEGGQDEDRGCHLHRKKDWTALTSNSLFHIIANSAVSINKS